LWDVPWADGTSEL